MLAQKIHKILLYFAFNPAFAFQISVVTVKRESRNYLFRFFWQYLMLEVFSFFCLLLFPRIHPSSLVII